MNLIIKGDTSGVVEAIKGALQGLPQVRVQQQASVHVTFGGCTLLAPSSRTGVLLGLPTRRVSTHPVTPVL